MLDPELSLQAPQIEITLVLLFNIISKLNERIDAKTDDSGSCL